MTNPVMVKRRELNQFDEPICYGFWVWCPGCDQAHRLRTVLEPPAVAPDGPVWAWDGNMEAPTFDPSYVTWLGPKENPTSRCHSYIKAGKWEFISDSTHALAGKTVPMVPLPDWLVR